MGYYMEQVSPSSAVIVCCCMRMIWCTAVIQVTLIVVPARLSSNQILTFPETNHRSSLTSADTIVRRGDSDTCPRTRHDRFTSRTRLIARIKIANDAIRHYECTPLILTQLRILHDWCWEPSWMFGPFSPNPEPRPSQYHPLDTAKAPWGRSSTEPN